MSLLFCNLIYKGKIMISKSNDTCVSSKETLMSLAAAKDKPREAPSTSGKKCVHGSPCSGNLWRLTSHSIVYDSRRYSSRCSWCWTWLLLLLMDRRWMSMIEYGKWMTCCRRIEGHPDRSNLDCRACTGSTKTRSQCRQGRCTS